MADEKSFVSTLEEAGKLIEEYEINTCSRFATYKKTKSFGSPGKRVNDMSKIIRNKMSLFDLILNIFILKL